MERLVVGYAFPFMFLTEMYQPDLPVTNIRYTVEEGAHITSDHDLIKYTFWWLHRFSFKVIHKTHQS